VGSLWLLFALKACSELDIGRGKSGWMAGPFMRPHFITHTKAWSNRRFLPTHGVFSRPADCRFKTDFAVSAFENACSMKTVGTRAPTLPTERRHCLAVFQIFRYEPRHRVDACAPPLPRVA
jgi:hypothetical protein